MAFTPNINDAFERTRNRNSFIPSDNISFSFFDAGLRPTSLRESAQQSSTDPARGSLQRRFTTNTVPLIQNVLSPIGQPRRQAMEASVGPDYSIAANQGMQLFEKKKAEYEHLKKKRLEFQNEMDLIDRKTNQQEDELVRLSRDLSKLGPVGGHQSEPTTPPEYRNENGFHFLLHRSNRFSTSQLTSPPGLNNRSRAGSQVTSTERARAYQALTGAAPSTMFPTSKQHLNEEEDLYEDTPLTFNHRTAASLNRNSMPVASRDMNSHSDPTDASALDAVNTSTFLFGDGFEKPSKRESTSSTPRALSNFLQMDQTADKFPILVRRDGDTAETLDSVANQTLEADNSSSGWPSTFNRALAPQAHLSMPSKSTGNSPPHGFPTPTSSGYATPSSSTNNDRHSMGARVNPFSQINRHSLTMNGGNGSVGVIGAPKLTQSYSTSDIPTIKNTITAGGAQAKMHGPAPTASEQRFLDHNASLGRIPVSALNNNRMSRDYSGSDYRLQESKISMPSMQPGLQASATPFGTNTGPHGLSNTPQMGYSNQPYYGGYGMQPGTQSLNVAMGNLQVNSHDGFVPQPSGFNAYQPTQAVNGAPRFRDSQARVIQQRRNQGGEEISRFAHIPLEGLHGEVFGLCKDQHGCRYLQKKLEERKPENVQMIFEETKGHIVDLMTDPFGNYLCQKLLEHATDEQRTVLMTNAAPFMVKIAMNQHGTRALQKMIDNVNTEEQKQIIIYALAGQVVPMIQDLNGNHVIQKCLNRLSSQDSQFIFDAVAQNCVAVGTHRHGCCVIQRCIDHASGMQKVHLIEAITRCAFPLVQDPFGNYVLQYIFDLGEEEFSQPLCRAFLGAIAVLSKQKFSSNVIEKCIRIADNDTRGSMIYEIVDSPEFEKLADDPFANYVVQTTWEYADDVNEALLAEKIRPVLPRMRHKPYGRRFASKLQERDRRLGVNNAQGNSSSESFSPAGPVYSAMAPPSSYNSHRQSHDLGAMQTNNAMFSGNSNHNGLAFGNNDNFGNGNHNNNNSRRFSNAAPTSTYNGPQPNVNSFQPAIGNGFQPASNGFHTTGNGQQSYQPTSRLSTHGMSYY